MNQNAKYIKRFVILMDGMSIIMMIIAAWFVRFQSGIFNVDVNDYLTLKSYTRHLFWLIPLYLILYQVFGVYGEKPLRSMMDNIVTLFKANIVGIALYFTYLFLTNNDNYSRLVLLLYLMLNMLFEVVIRILLRSWLTRRSMNLTRQKPIVLVGAGELAQEYAKRLRQNPHLGYLILGIFDDQPKQYINLYKKAYPRLGGLNDLNAFLEKEHVDEVIITLPLDQYGHLERIVNICEKQGVYTRIIPDYYKIIPAKPYIEELEDLPIISIRMVPLTDWFNKGVKRLVDVVFSFVGLLLLIPFWIIMALLIKGTSKGPVFYKQTRVGMDRKNFKMYKFRTMIVQTEREEKKRWTVKNDTRVTPLGRWLRKFSIDELPQLWNVLKGDMSLVGPRPERPQFVEKYKEEIPKYMVKHMVRPGMTGWAQIHGWRGDTSIRRRIEHDLYYIENWTLRMDFRIMFRTIGKVINDKNAY